MLKKIVTGASLLVGVAVVTVSMQTSKAKAGVKIYVRPPVVFYGRTTHRPYVRRHSRYRWGRRHCHIRWRNGYRVRRCHRHKIYY